MIDDGLLDVVNGRQVGLRDRKADGVGESLTERPGRHLDAGRVMRFRMPGRLAAKLAERFEVVKANLVARKIEQRIQEHRRVPGAQNKAIAIGPCRVLGIESEVFGPERIRRGRRAERHPGMSGVCLLHGIDRKKADRVDTPLVVTRIGHGCSFSFRGCDGGDTSIALLLPSVAKTGAGSRRAGAVARRMDVAALQAEIEALDGRSDAVKGEAGIAIERVIAALDRGELRVCEPSENGWITHAWIKRAILLYFLRRDAAPIGEYGYDKIPLKTNYAELGARCVPPGTARYGSYLGKGAILMPGYVNIGAYVDEDTMIDTWATVGSCAQVGKRVHVSGGVGIGGVLEPEQAQPVVIEDGAFVGSRCVVVEGVRVAQEAVLGAGVVLTASTPIVDVRGSAPQQLRAQIPPRSVVIPGTLPKRMAGQIYGVPCALIVGTRSESTDSKTSLNAALRDYEVAV